LADGHEGLRFGHLGVDLAKVVVASLAMGVVVGTGWWFWPQPVITKFNDALGLAVLIGVGVASYGGLLWLLRIEGRDDLAAMVAKVRAKFS
jgi:putative peptidoglycan lipid II flippase